MLEVELEVLEKVGAIGFCKEIFFISFYDKRETKPLGYKGRARLYMHIQ